MIARVLVALGGGASGGIGAILGRGEPAWLGALAGAAAAAAAHGLARRTLDAPRLALLSGVWAAILLAPLAYLAPARVLLALALGTGALLATRAADPLPPLLPVGAPAAALAAIWAYPAVGFASLVAVVLLLGGHLPARSRLGRDTLPPLAALVVASIAILALPVDLLPVPLPLRGLLLVLAVVGNAALASRLPATRLGPGGRRLVAVALALLVPTALLATLVAAQRLGLAGARNTAVLVGATLFALVLLGGILVAATILLATRHRAKAWLVATALGAGAAFAIGPAALVLLLPGTGVVAALLTLRGTPDLAFPARASG